jgi:hypothetical protein
VNAVQLLASTARSTQGDGALSTIGRQQLPDDISRVAFGTYKDGWAKARWGDLVIPAGWGPAVCCCPRGQ